MKQTRHFLSGIFLLLLFFGASAAEIGILFGEAAKGEDMEELLDEDGVCGDQKTDKTSSKEGDAPSKNAPPLPLVCPPGKTKLQGRFKCVPKTAFVSKIHCKEASVYMEDTVLHFPYFLLYCNRKVPLRIDL